MADPGNYEIREETASHVVSENLSDEEYSEMNGLLTITNKATGSTVQIREEQLDDLMEQFPSDEPVITATKMYGTAVLEPHTTGSKLTAGPEGMVEFESPEQVEMLKEALDI